MRIAVFNTYLDNIGGGEIVGLTLARELKADTYSTNIDKKKIKKMGFSGLKIDSIGQVPKDPPFRPQKALGRFRKLDLGNEYDFYIINGEWSVSGAMNNKPNLWYVNALIREIWDLYEFTREYSVPPIKRPIFDMWVRYNRGLNRRYVKHIGKIIANSQTSKKWVKKYLKRDCVVIHPPTETGKFSFNKSGDFWLSVNRLTPYKRVDMQIRAFRKLPKEKLVIVGSYEKAEHFQKYADDIMKNKSENVEVLSWVSQEKLHELYANCKGLIATSKDEVFGMTPVEAMASGKPVIAAKEGGYKETVVDGVTGKLIDKISAQKLAAAVKEVGKDTGSFKYDCIKRASQFDTKVFIGKIKEQIEG